MRVVIAPDKFAGTLTAVEAADAIAEGWRRTAPDAELVKVPMSDGGPGFVSVLHEVLGGELLATRVTGAYGDPTPAALLKVGDTAYVESAQAIGLHLTDRRDPMVATSAGVGELVGHAVDSGARRILVGLGGSATNDGGAGLLAALGAQSTPEGALTGGPAGLEGLQAVDLAPARARVRDVELVAATDVDHMLLGLVGATKTFGPQKGLTEEQLLTVDGRLQRLAELTDRKLANEKGTGAAGGLGFALMLLGARRQPGVELVAEAVDLPGTAKGADLLITGEGAFDFSSRAGKVPYGVAEVAVNALAPCIVLAGRVQIGARETRAIGVESAYSLTELVGEERALQQPREALADLAARVARTWSRE
ncbi:MAG TPA: glycerate kinase [Marmoricola sp.]|nr:glycerate kinase [Marmoricola sp.]